MTENLEKPKEEHKIIYSQHPKIYPINILV